MAHSLKPTDFLSAALDLIGCGLYIGTKYVVHAFGKAGLFAVFDVDDSLEGFMEAVFAPCLGEHLEFDIGAGSSLGGEVIADGREFPEIESGPSFLIERREPIVVEPMNGDRSIK